MNNFTEIVMLIDKSGSMYHLIDDTIGGFNGYIDSQKKIEGYAEVTTVLFSSDTQVLHDGVDIKAVEPITKNQYVPSGNTALLDAIGETIEKIQTKHDNVIEPKRPNSVLFVIITDGQENASKKYKKSQIQNMITHQQKSHHWEFVFLGANMDAVSEAASYGISYASDWTANSAGTANVYAAVDCASKSIRADGDLSSWTTSINLGGATTPTITAADGAISDFAKAYADTELNSTNVSGV